MKRETGCKIISTNKDMVNRYTHKKKKHSIKWTKKRTKHKTVVLNKTKNMAMTTEHHTILKNQ